MRLPGWSKDVAGLQATMVFLLALTFGLLASSLRSMLFVPHLNTYLISEAVGGVLLGGMFFVMRHLLKSSKGAGSLPLPRFNFASFLRWGHRRQASTYDMHKDSEDTFTFNGKGA